MTIPVWLCWLVGITLVLALLFCLLVGVAAICAYLSWMRSGGPS